MNCDVDDVISLAILGWIVLRWVTGVMRSRRGGGAAAAPSRPTVVEEAPPEATGPFGGEEALPEGEVPGMRELRDLLGQTRGVEGRVRELVGAGRDDPALVPLSRGLENSLLPELGQLQGVLAEAEANLERLHRAGDWHEVSAASLAEARQVVGRLSLAGEFARKAVAEHRSGRRPALLQAEAVAMALYRPVGEALASGGLVVSPARDAVAAFEPAPALQAAGVLAPGGGPLVVLVPLSFPDSPFAWAMLAQDVGFDLLARVPGLAGEVEAAVAGGGGGGGDAAPLLALHRLIVPWSGRFFADVLGTILLGPGYGAALLGVLATPGRPNQAGIARADPRSGQGTGAGGARTIPPACLRLEVAAATLARMGFDQDASGLREEWWTRHRGLDAVVVPLGSGQYARLPAGASPVLAQGLAGSLLGTPYAALGGQDLLRFGSLALTPADQAAVRTLADRFGDRTVLPAPVRIAIPAGVMAAREGRVGPGEVVGLVESAAAASLGETVHLPARGPVPAAAVPILREGEEAAGIEERPAVEEAELVGRLEAARLAQAAARTASRPERREPRRPVAPEVAAPPSGVEEPPSLPAEAEVGAFPASVVFALLSEPAAVAAAVAIGDSLRISRGFPSLALRARPRRRGTGSGGSRTG